MINLTNEQILKAFIKTDGVRKALRTVATEAQRAYDEKIHKQCPHKRRGSWRRRVDCEICMSELRQQLEKGEVNEPDKLHREADRTSSNSSR